MKKQYLFHKDGIIPNYQCVWVFGSNLAGRHGAGAAKIAKDIFKAESGVGKGITGNSFAIATKGHKLEVLGIDEIKKQIDDFIDYATFNKSKIFFVTRVGCGLAGYLNQQIAPLFLNAPTNCEFPQEWEPYLSSLEKCKRITLDI